MHVEYLSEVRGFIEKFTDPSERIRRFCPLTLRPVEIASIIERLKGIYDTPDRTPSAGTVLIGSTVDLLDMPDGTEIRVEIVLPDYSDPSQGRISVLSPLGSSLLGAGVGEIIDIFVGNRMTRFRVLSIA